MIDKPVLWIQRARRPRQGLQRALLNMETWSVPKMGGPQYRPQYTIILILGSPNSRFRQLLGLCRFGASLFAGPPFCAGLFFSARASALLAMCIFNSGTGLPVPCQVLDHQAYVQFRQQPDQQPVCSSVHPGDIDIPFSFSKCPNKPQLGEIGSHLVSQRNTAQQFPRQ